MGEKDITQKVFWENNERFADFVNTVVFDGAQEINANDLIEQDTAKYRSGKRGRQPLQKQRDAVCRVARDMSFLLIGIENQDCVNYAMPLRVLGFDYLDLERQRRVIARRIRKKKGLTREEYLSGYTKTERLMPVITIVLYYGEEPWDGARSLWDMLDLRDVPEKLKKMMCSCPLNLVEVRRFDQEEKFRTDLREVFGFIKRAGDKESLRAYMEEAGDRLLDMAEDAYDVVAAVTGAEELEELREKMKTKTGGINMCRALKEMCADSREEGRAEGREEGREEGRQEMRNAIKEMCADSREEGRAEGREEGEVLAEQRLSRLILLLMDRGSEKELRRVAEDPVYRKEMMAAYIG